MHPETSSLNRVIPVWNESPKIVREAGTLNGFKAGLDRVDLFITIRKFLLNILQKYLSLYFIYGFQLKLYWKIIYFRNAYILIRSLLLLLLRLVNMSRISDSHSLFAESKSFYRIKISLQVFDVSNF